MKNATVWIQICISVTYPIIRLCRQADTHIKACRQANTHELGPVDR